jgi:hypothetical protein
MTKYGDRPHWEFEATFLGSDGHGDWVGIPAGTPMARPGASFVPPVDSVLLVPAGGEGWLGTFYAPGFRVTTYVDVTGVPRWDGPVLRAVDLDLDVVRGETGRCWIDDEDEFAAHIIEFGYPADLVAAASSTCDELLRRLRAGEGPFDPDVPARWLDVLRLARGD